MLKLIRAKHGIFRTAILITVEPLYNGHHWEPKFCHSNVKLLTTVAMVDNPAEKVDESLLSQGR